MYSLKDIADQKIKKQDHLTIELEKNPDILFEMGQKKAKQLVIGFAAETENLIGYAERKMEQKNLDAIFANSVADPEHGFDVDDNAGYLITRAGEVIEFPNMPKIQLAKEIIEFVNKKLSR